MNHHSHLAANVRHMREAGLSVDEIISTLGKSWKKREIARRIVRKYETEAVLLARSNRFIEEIRSADDLDKEWRVSLLMQALRPKGITQISLIRHFVWSNCTAINLRQLMDLTISEEPHPWPGYLISPILRVRCVGINGFWSVVRRLTESDLGQRCNLEWRKRTVRLMQSSRILDGRGGWSKPYELPDWLSKESSATTSAAPNQTRMISAVS